MEPFENQELSDHELDGMLREWKAPPAPAGMRAAVFAPRSVPWWKRTIHVPIPVAACVALVLAFAGWRIATPPLQRPVENPPVMHGLTFHELRPVASLQPRIIRRENAKN